MKTLVVLAIMFAGKANWTGRFERVTLYDHSQGINCQYVTPLQQMFWQSFRGLECPRTVDVP